MRKKNYEELFTERYFYEVTDLGHLGVGGGQVLIGQDKYVNGHHSFAYTS